jgi:hypothetical protein
MIKATFEEEDAFVEIAGKEANTLDAGDDYVLAECDLSDLVAETADAFPEVLQLQIHSEDGFATYFFHELLLSHHADGVALEFRCHTPNKYWEGRFGLATFLAAIRNQVPHFDNWEITQIELEDDWKGITLRRLIAKAIHSTPAFSTQQPTSSTFSMPPRSHFRALNGRRRILLTRICFAESYFIHCSVAWNFSLCDTRMARRSMGRTLHFRRTLHLAHIATTVCKRRQETSAAASTPLSTSFLAR